MDKFICRLLSFLQSIYNSRFPLFEMSPLSSCHIHIAERRFLPSDCRLTSTAKWVYFSNTSKDRDLNHEADTSSVACVQVGLSQGSAAPLKCSTHRNCFSICRYRTLDQIHSDSRKCTSWLGPTVQCIVRLIYGRVAIDLRGFALDYHQHWTPLQP
jgi:hypothetical protein